MPERVVLQGRTRVLLPPQVREITGCVRGVNPLATGRVGLPWPLENEIAHGAMSVDQFDDRLAVTLGECGAPPPGVLQCGGRDAPP